jgi:hypothetical protein
MENKLGKLTSVSQKLTLLYSVTTGRTVFGAGVDLWTDAGATLERASRDAGLEEEDRLFVQLAFTEPQSFL